MQSTANVHSYPDTSSRSWLSSVRIPLSIALLSPGLAGISLLPAAAQVAGPAQQRAGRRTPPALLVRPEDALQSLRTAMLLGSVVPELRIRAEKLAGDLTELVTLRKTIATERDRLAVDRDKLREDQTRLAALVEERQRQQSSIEKDLEVEGARAIALSRQVDSLQGLIAKMEQDG